MKRIVSAAALTACSLLAPSALALGLGEINVRSHLSQRFSASIPLNTDGANEAANLRVSLAGIDEYAQAGIPRDLVLSSLRFSIKAEEQPRIEISSTAPINEPFLQVLLEVKGGGQRLVRQYTVLLDPPGSATTAAATATKPAPAVVKPVPAPAPAAPAAPVQAKPAAAPAVAQAPAPAAAARPAAEDSFYETADEAARTKPAASAEAVVAAAAADARQGALYGPVKSGETLWSIAVAMRPDSSVMVDQVLLALYKANPRAFEGGLNSLLRGAMLRVPTLAEMTSASPETAQAEIARLRGVRPRRGEPSASRRQPRLEPAEIVAPPPASMQSAEPAPAATPAPVTAPAATAPVAAAEPAPAMIPPAPAGDAATTVPADVDAAATAGDPATGAEPAAGATPTVAPPAESPLPPADADVLETAATPARTAEPAGIVEKLLLPMLFGLIAISGLLWLIGRIRKRRAHAPQAPIANIPPPVRSAESAARRLASEPSRATATAAAVVPASIAGVISEPDAAAVSVASDSSAPGTSSTPLVDLDGGDPLAEAEFNIAYGLHDEAIPLLRRAQAAEPQRTEISVKLAKSLLAAGRREEFDATVAALETRLPPDQLRQLMLLAGAASAATASGTAATSAELPAAAPEEPSGPMPAEEPAFEPQSLTAHPAVSVDAPLEFELESFDLPPVESQHESAPPASTAVERDDKGSMVEFDLSGFDLDPPPPADVAAARAEPMAAVEFDLGDFEPAPAAAPATLGDADIQLDDFDFGVEPEEESAAISGDEAGTKLDLARAYVEMGDNEMARGLLNEVVKQGNDAQRADARTLLDRLG